MRKLLSSACLTLFLMLLHRQVVSQTVSVTQACVTGTISLTANGTLNGKTLYTGSGTVASTANTAVSLYWIGGTDNVWVLDFDGQPYFQNSAALAQPPMTTNLTYSWSGVSGTTCTGTNAISITSNQPLPVTLAKLEGRFRDGKVDLSWQTVSELNNLGFDIERQEQTGVWKKIGFLPGAGNSQSLLFYTWTDQTPLPGKNLYRLKQIDLDQQFSYSETIIIAVNERTDLQIFNNPVSGTLKLNLELGAGERAEMRLTDLQGRTLINRFVKAGLNEFDLRAYQPGIYVLQIKTASRTITEKIVRK